MTTAMPEVAAPSKPRSCKTGPILLLVFGSLVALLAMSLLAGGGVVTWANHTQRDRDGYFMTSSEPFSTSTYALSESDIDLRDWPSWLKPGELGKVRIAATSTDGKPVFVGIAPKRAVDSYLASVAHAEVTNVDYDPFSADYATKGGGAPSTKPAAAHLWAASASGAGEQTVTWNPTEGEWTAVVMNADGSRGVHADVAVGANVSYLGWIEGGLIGAGLLLLAGGAAMIWFGGRGLDRSSRSGASA